MKKESNHNLLKKYDYMKHYYDIVRPILDNEEFKKRKNWRHHGDTSLYDHSLQVSLLAYRLSFHFKSMDNDIIAIGGLLHDFYNKPWMENTEKKPLLQKHGFVHAAEARENAYLYFSELMNPVIDNIILRHMFPLNKIPPKYKEAWLVSLADKIVSIDFLEKENIVKLFSKERKMK